MNTWGSILYTILDILIKMLLPVIAGYAINYLNKKLGRERFMLAREIVASIVSSLEQQYRSGEIPKDDRFALAMEQGIKRTGLSEDQVAQLIKEAVFRINVSMNKYNYAKVSTGFALQGQSLSVSPGQPTVTPVAAGPDQGSAVDNAVLPAQEV